MEYNNPIDIGLLPLVRSLIDQEDSAIADVENGFSYADRLAQREEELLANGHQMADHSPFYKMAQFKKPSAEALKLGAMARQQLEATKLIRAQYIQTLLYFLNTKINVCHVFI